MRLWRHFINGIPLIFLCGMAQASPALLLNSITVPPGQPALLTVSINSEATGVNAILLNVTFTEVTPTSAPALALVGLGKDRVIGPFQNSSLQYASTDPLDPVTGIPLDGRRDIGIVRPEPVDGPADIIQLPFQAPASAPMGTVYTIKIAGMGFDSFGEKIPLDAVAGTITLGGSIPGDVNGNGKVEVGDALLVLQAALGLITLTPAAQAQGDLNHNNRLEVGDAVAILRLAVGLKD